MSRKIVLETQNNLKVLKGLRLSKLANIDSKVSRDQLITLLFSTQDRALARKLESFPDDLSLLIYSKAWKLFMDSLLGNVKKLITEHNIIFKDTGFQHQYALKPLIAWQYVFKIIHFLLQNDFITQEHYRSIFHDYNVVRQVIYYTSELFKSEKRKFGVFSGELDQEFSESLFGSYIQYFSGEEE
ncbi:hypothetical protein VP01_1850g4 [Puccinia sorghi]|uniref:Uncharacterized protein n=1 Tax=Puccinia sorghi TaxID=27349 RepID=A0A0L6VDL6_9BASI|nr:hypothetical protein VP01_1850g4 [Puccinia sorghi]